VKIFSHWFLLPSINSIQTPQVDHIININTDKNILIKLTCFNSMKHNEKVTDRKLAGTSLHIQEELKAVTT